MDPELHHSLVEATKELLRKTRALREGGEGESDVRAAAAAVSALMRQVPIEHMQAQLEAKSPGEPVYAAVIALADARPLMGPPR